MGDKPSQPWNTTGIRRVQRWRRGHANAYDTATITLSITPGGQWLVEQSRVTAGARAYDSEQDARHAIGRLQAGGGWVETPANYDARHQPTEPGWTKRGGQWIREPVSNDPTAAEAAAASPAASPAPPTCPATASTPPEPQ
ncbi:hypothetical protein [Micromonospora sediminicola]|uniref:hypothetical protein n=1 Tax=Micromonospora sediminicola TaxID=946078 RepID=UPI003793F3AF